MKIAAAMKSQSHMTRMKNPMSLSPTICEEHIQKQTLVSQIVNILP